VIFGRLPLRSQKMANEVRGSMLTRFLKFAEIANFSKFRAFLGKGRLPTIGILICALYLQIYDPAALENFRNRVFDYYQQWHPRTPPPTNPVAIVDIDEKSLLSLGQWPWPRDYLATLVQNATSMGALVIGFDMVFAEEDRLSPNKMGETIASLSDQTQQELAGLPSFDSIFADQISKSRTVLGIAVSPTKTDVNNIGIARIATLGSLGKNPKPFLTQFSGLIGNIDILDSQASGRGMISLDQDFDGIIRRVPLANIVSGKIVPTLGLDMLRVATQRNVIVQANQDGIIGFRIAKTLVPTDKSGRIWIKYSQFDPTRYVSALDIINNQIDPNLIKGKFLLVGTSATGLKDLRSSPLQAALPGVEIHLQLLENILTQDYLYRPDYLAVLEWIGTSGTGLFLILLVPLFGARATLALLLVISSIAVSSSLFLFAEFSLLIDVTYTLFISIILYISLVYSNYLSTERERTRIRTAFAHYLSPDLVSKLSASPDSLVLGGEVKEMTFLFCDIRDFTSISEGFKDDPQGLTGLINSFLTPMTAQILNHNGTIDKYMGDSIMAFWNAPLPIPEHQNQAATSALRMIRSLRILNKELEIEAQMQDRPYRELKIGIGLNTGTCIVGNLGSEQRFDYSVLGDPVNLASRLEGQTKQYGVDIIVGEETAQSLPNYALIELDLIAVKGRQSATKIYSLMGTESLLNSDHFQNLKTLTQGFLVAYRSQNWLDASKFLAEIEAIETGLSIYCALFRDRIRKVQELEPLENWDGVYRAAEK
jgi:adenylate cyclase